MPNLLLPLVLATTFLVGAARSQCEPYMQSLDVVGVPGGGWANVLWDPDGAGPLPEVLVTGGEFSEAGTQLAANVAAYDFTTGLWSALGAGVNGAVNALAVLPTGELVAAGEFTIAGGTAAQRVAMWNGSSWSPLGNGLSGDVHALAVLPNGHLVSGGEYSTGVGFVSEWDGVAWTSLGFLTTSYWHVRSLSVAANGDLLAGTSGNTGLDCASVLRWDGNLWTLVGSLPPHPAVTFPFALPRYGSVYSVVELANGEIAAAGDFAAVGSSNLSAARWNGSTWLPLGAVGDEGDVLSLARSPTGVLWLGGSLQIGGVDCSIAEWNGSGVAPLGAGLTGFAVAVTALPSGNLVAGGPLTLNGSAVSHAEWDGVAWTPLVAASSLDFTVHSLASLPNGEFLAGGGFLFAGSTAVNMIARRSGSAWIPLGAGLGTIGHVTAIAVMPNGDVMASGTSHRVAHWDGASWTGIAAGLGPSAGVLALAVLPNGDLVAGGLLNDFGMNGIARWDGTTWSPLGSGFAGIWPVVHALAIMPNGDLIAAGSFDTAGGIPANNIARWDGSSWSPLGNGTSAPVFAVDVWPNGQLVAGGVFASAGTVATQAVARWDGSQWQAVGTGLGGTFPIVHAVGALPNGDVLIGGDFDVAGGTPVSSIARWNGSTWSAVGTLNILSVPSHPEVYALAELSTGEWLAGGTFEQADGRAANYLVSLTGDCLATAAVAGTGCASSAGIHELTATTLPWTGSVFHATASGMPANAIATVVWGLQPAATLLSQLLPQAGAGCMLLASPDVITLSLPVAGVVATQLAVPNSVALVGAELNEQVAAIELDAQGAILAVTSSNALRLTIGSF